ncbi:MAG TPA: SBBP repeat-containing protein [Terriglobia bacterium]|nr:SBBP repeat-containing protein [Terriglobia bacterium]
MSAASGRKAQPAWRWTLKVALSIVGATPSEDFPVTPGAFRIKNYVRNNDHIGFVSKLSEDGSNLVYSTLLGGSFRTQPYAVAADRFGNAYVVGGTCSSDFPVTIQAPQGRAVGSRGSNATCDGFITKLNTTGSKTEYSTYFGGSGSDGVSTIAVDVTGRAWFGGWTSSVDLPMTSGALQQGNGGVTDGFVGTLDPSGKTLMATYLGGSGPDSVTSIKIHSDGSIYVAGNMASNEFPRNPSHVVGTQGASDIFIAKLNPSLKTVPVFLRIGGAQNDSVSSMDIDAEGNVFIAGTTQSHDFPVTKGAWNPVFRGGTKDGFVLKIQPNAFETKSFPVVWATFVGGSGEDELFTVSAGLAGSVFAGGRSSSKDFPTTKNAFRPQLQRANDGCLIQISSADGKPQFVTFIADAKATTSFNLTPINEINDQVTEVVATRTGDVFVTGWTKGIDYLISRNAYQKISKGNTEPFLFRLRFSR